MSKVTLHSLIKAAVTKGVTEARAAIFGHVLNPTGQRSSHKLLSKKLIGDKVAAYHPYDTRRDNPEYMAAKERMRQAKLDNLRRRGKGAPKKGEGKRAAKRK